MSDLRYALRQAARRPGETLLVVLLLAVGLGGASAVLSLADAVFLKPLPGVRAPNLAAVYRHHAGRGEYGLFSYPDFKDLDGAGGGDVRLAAHVRAPIVIGGDVRAAQSVVAELVSGNYFQLVGTRPAQGRLLAPEDSAQARPVAVVSRRLSERIAGRGGELVGETLLINQREYSVVGVAERGFRGLWLDSPPDVWIPITLQPQILTGLDLMDEQARSLPGWILLVARLAPGVDYSAAQQSMEPTFQRLARNRPREKGWSLSVLPPSYARFWPGFRAILARLLGLLGSVALLVLLAGCGSALHLLWMRNLERRREWAVRLALGAGRGRIWKQSFLEAALPVAAGGLAAFAAGQLWLRLILSHQLGFPIEVQASWGGRYWIVSGGVTLAIGGLLALFTLAGQRWPSSRALREDRRQSPGRGGAAMQRLMIAAQACVALLLIWSAALLLQSVRQLWNVDWGFRTRGLAVARVDVFPTGYDDSAADAFFRRLQRRLVEDPAVSDAAYTSMRFVTQVRHVRPVAVAGRAEPVEAHLHSLSPGAADLLEIPILRGRGFEPRDDAQAPAVAIIDQRFAERCWPGRDPVGRTVTVGNEQRPRRVVGVASPVLVGRPWEPSVPIVYLPASQRPIRDADFYIDAHQHPAAALQALRRAVREMEPAAVVAQAESVEEHLAGEFSQQRLAAKAAATGAGAGLLMALAGIYAVFSHRVQRRRFEFAIRIALGAGPLGVSKLILAESLALCAMGLAAALILAAFLSPWLSGNLYGVAGNDLATAAAVSLLLLLSAALATLLPARRAFLIQPAEALRSE